jgi:hypothetical protein
MERSETYRWKEKVFDINRLLRDIDRKIIAPEIINLERAFIKGYCELYLDIDAREPRPPIFVDHDYTRSITRGRLSTPIIILHVGEDDGLVTFRENCPDDAHYVVGDGSHRLLAARAANIVLKAYVLNSQQSRRYEIPEVPPEGH